MQDKITYVGTLARSAADEGGVIAGFYRCIFVDSAIRTLPF